MTAEQLANDSYGGLVVVVVILAFAVYRLSRFISVDKLTEDFRMAVFRRGYDAEGDGYVEKSTPWVWLNALLSCPHCIGVWIGVPLSVAWWYGSWLFLPVLILAALGMQSFAHSIAGD